MNILYYIFYLFLSILITSCASNGFKVSSVSNYEGHFKIGNPYQVAGKTYTPYHDEEYKEEGMASWYGPGFHARKTANGDTYDQRSFTAAHRTLPLPSVVKVTSLETGKDVVVMVNDRGPYAGNRIIDLSEKVAEHLGVKHKGVSKVRVEYLKDETDKLIAKLDMVETKSAKVKTQTKEKIVLVKNTKKAVIRKPSLNKKPDKLFVQVAALKEKEQAVKLFDEVSSIGLAKIEELSSVNENIFRVYIGPLDNEKAANHILKKLKTNGHDGSFIVSY